MSHKVWKVGDHIDTDLIIAARYLNDASEENMRIHAMEDVIENFSDVVQKGDVIVAGKNFGSGSSREHAPLAIKVNGVACVIAESFARIFFRNAINIGLPIIECPEASQAIQDGDELDIDMAGGRIDNITQGTSYTFEKLPPFIQEIVEAGSLMAYTKAKGGHKA